MQELIYTQTDSPAAVWMRSERRKLRLINWQNQIRHCSLRMLRRFYRYALKKWIMSILHHPDHENNRVKSNPFTLIMTWMGTDVFLKSPVNFSDKECLYVSGAEHYLQTIWEIRQDMFIRFFMVSLLMFHYSMMQWCYLYLTDRD